MLHVLVQLQVEPILRNQQLPTLAPLLDHRRWLVRQRIVNIVVAKIHILQPQTSRAVVPTEHVTEQVGRGGKVARQAHNELPPEEFPRDVQMMHEQIPPVPSGQVPRQVIILHAIPARPNVLV